MTLGFETWLYPTPQGLYCAAGGFHIDPHAAVGRAVITPLGYARPQPYTIHPWI